MKTLNELLKNDWSYKHEFGVISYEGFTPTLVITERKYWKAESWGYHFYKLATSVSENLLKEKAKLFNTKYGLPLYFDGKNSQDFLLTISYLFPESEIRK